MAKQSPATKAWVCPICERSYNIRITADEPDICPHCTDDDDSEMTQRQKLNTSRGKETFSPAAIGCLIVIILGCAVVVLLPRGDDPNRSGQGTSDVSVTGDMVVFKQDCFVAATEDVYGRVVQLSNARDEQGISQLVRSGQVRVIKAGAKAKVIDTNILTYEIRLLDGWSGFVAAEFVGKE